MTRLAISPHLRIHQRWPKYPHRSARIFNLSTRQLSSADYPSDYGILVAKHYIAEVHDNEFIKNNSVPIYTIVIETFNKLFVIFLLSPGSDPKPFFNEATSKAKMKFSTIYMKQVVNVN